MFGLLRHVFLFSLKGECNKGLWLMYYLGYMLVLIILCIRFGATLIYLCIRLGLPFFYVALFLWNGCIWRARLGWCWVRVLYLLKGINV